MAVTRKKLEVKTAFKVITGKMSVTEGMERNQDITVAQMADIAVNGIKTGVKAVATAVFGPVGAVVSTVVKKVGEKVIETGKKIVSKAKELGGKVKGFFKGLFG